MQRAYRQHSFPILLLNLPHKIHLAFSNYESFNFVLVTHTLKTIRCMYCEQTLKVEGCGRHLARVI